MHRARDELAFARAEAIEQGGEQRKGKLLARGSLGNPWLFAQLLDERQGEPTREEILDELDWVVDRAVEHLGEERAARYLRKFHPWYVERLGEGKAVQAALQQAETIAEQRAVIDGLRPLLAA